MFNKYFPTYDFACIIYDPALPVQTIYCHFPVDTSLNHCWVNVCDDV